MRWLIAIAMIWIVAYVLARALFFYVDWRRAVNK